MIGVEIVAQGKDSEIFEYAEQTDDFDEKELNLERGNYWYITDVMSRSEFNAEGKAKTTITNSMNSHRISYCEIISVTEQLGEALDMFHVLVGVIQSG